MHKFMMGGLAAVALVVAVPQMAAAETSPASAAAGMVDPVTPAKIALTKRYIAAMHMDQMMSGMMHQMIPAMMTQMRKQHPEITDEQMSTATDAVTGAMDDMMPKMTERLTQIYAETFSTEELTKLDAFYESPIGQSILAKIPAATQKMIPMMMEMMPDMQADMMKRMCGKISCPAGMPDAKPSA